MAAKFQKVILFIALGILAFFTSNSLLYPFTKQNVSLGGCLLAVPTFFVYIYIHTKFPKK